MTAASCRHSCAASLTSAPLLLQVNSGMVVAVGPGRRTSAGELIVPAVKEVWHKAGWGALLQFWNQPSAVVLQPLHAE